MARKIFQHFAHVLCQRFIEVPSSRDLVNLALFGGGRLELDITGNQATCNLFPVTPLPYSGEALRWLAEQIASHDIPREQLVGASLVVDYSVDITRRPDMPVFPIATFQFACEGSIVSPDRRYVANLEASKVWGLTGV